MISYSIANLLLLTVGSSAIRRLGTTGGRQAFRDAKEGLKFIRKSPVLFGAISLDLIAVLLGGAVALLPAIAENRLGVGAVGVGWLRAAVGIGATIIAVTLSIRPLKVHIGRALMTAVATAAGAATAAAAVAAKTAAATSKTAAAARTTAARAAATGAAAAATTSRSRQPRARCARSTCCR